MAQVSKERILELQQIIKEDYGRDVSFAEASEIARDVVGYFDTLENMYHEMQKLPKKLTRKFHQTDLLLAKKFCDGS